MLLYVKVKTTIPSARIHFYWFRLSSEKRVHVQSVLLPKECVGGVLINATTGILVVQEECQMGNLFAFLVCTVNAEFLRSTNEILDRFGWLMNACM